MVLKRSSVLAKSTHRDGLANFVYGMRELRKWTPWQCAEIQNS
jgi:hypothetical protein